MNRNICVVCDSSLLNDIYHLTDFPSYMGVTEQDPETDKRYSQDWQFCNQCAGVQLKQPIPLEVLYANNHHNGPIGRVWLNHHQKFYSFIRKHSVGSSSILEIGAGDGYLARLVTEKTTKMKYTVVEPSPTFKNPKVNIVRDVIENRLDEVKNVDVVVHSHVLEHIYQPNVFFQNISESMDIGKVMLMSIPNMEKILKGFGSNSLNFEHTYFLDVNAIKFWSATNGMEIESVEYYLDHSIFLKLRKTESTCKKQIEFPRRDCEPAKLFVEMWNQIKEFVEESLKVIETNNENLFLFGAHIFSQGFLAQGLPEFLVKGVLDNDPAKQDKRLYGTNLKVMSPIVLRYETTPLVMLSASHYHDEVKKQILGINSNSLILELR